MAAQNADYVRDSNSKLEAVAWAFHDEYEALAKEIGYSTRSELAVPWADVPSLNKRLMMGVVGRLITKGVVHFGAEVNGMVPDRGAHLFRLGAEVTIEQNAVRGEIVGLDFESDSSGTIVHVRVPTDARIGHWWISLAPTDRPIGETP